MDRAEFWLSELKLKGTLRMAPEDAARLAGQETTGLAAALPTAPGWGEMRYLNTFRGTGPSSKRDWLLGWVIACVNEQFGFALDLCRRAHVAIPDPLFVSLAAETDRMIHQKLRSQRAAVAVRSAVRGVRSFGRWLLKPERPEGKP
jgi:hypothetical protein